MQDTEINKRSYHKLNGVGLLIQIALFVTMLSLLASCGEDQEDLGLPGQLLLRDNDKLVILDGSGHIEARLDVETYGARWSPDGQRVLFNDGEFNIYILESETKRQVKLFGGEASFYPYDSDWSPSGQEIAAIGAPRDENEKGLSLYTANVAKASAPFLVWKCEYWCNTLQWSLDEETVFVSEFAPTKTSPSMGRLVRVNVHTGEATTIFSIDMGIDEFRWDPQEEQVAVVAYGHGLFLLDKDGQFQRHISTNRVGGLTWSPDGKWLAFNQEASESASRTNVSVYSLETGEIKKVYPRGVKGLFEPPAQPYVLGWRK